METFIAPFKLVIGEYGCYAIDFIEFFAVMVLQVSSFYWSLYRYICIVHSSVVLRLGLSPMVRKYTVSISIQLHYSYRGSPTSSAYATMDRLCWFI